jgi:group I intron endonuclease
VTGIYGIQNSENGKWYIGQSVNIESRWKQHQDALNHGNHHNSVLQREYKEFGPKKFIFQVLDICEIDQLDEREVKYFKVYNSDSNGYNLPIGARNQYHINRDAPKYKDAETKHKDAETKHTEVSLFKKWPGWVEITHFYANGDSGGILFKDTPGEYEFAREYVSKYANGLESSDLIAKLSALENGR